MTDQKPTGVFVRPRLSNEQLGKLLAPMDTLNERMLAIGTPVTGGDLEVAAYDNIASGQLSRVRPCGANINLVRQSDAQAKIAALEAYVARLRTEDDKALTQVIEERDECEQVINDLYQAVMGYPPEWSNNFGYRDAVKDVVDYVHALRTEALKGGAA